MDPIYLAHFITEDVSINNGMIVEFTPEQVDKMIQDFVQEKGRPDAAGAFKTYVKKFASVQNKEIFSGDFLNPDLMRELMEPAWMQYTQTMAAGNPEGQPSASRLASREKARMNTQARIQNARDQQIDQRINQQQKQQQLRKYGGGPLTQNLAGVLQQA